MSHNQTVEEARALHNLSADGINWSFDSEAGLIWDIPNLVIPAPTQAEINAEIVRFTTEDEANAYKLKRRSEYPKIQECIHAILDDDLTALQLLRQAVKDKYPKP